MKILLFALLCIVFFCNASSNNDLCVGIRFNIQNRLGPDAQIYGFFFIHQAKGVPLTGQIGREVLNNGQSSHQTEIPPYATDETVSSWTFAAIVRINHQVPRLVYVKLKETPLSCSQDSFSIIVGRIFAEGGWNAMTLEISTERTTSRFYLEQQKPSAQYSELQETEFLPLMRDSLLIEGDKNGDCINTRYYFQNNYADEAFGGFWAHASNKDSGVQSDTFFKLGQNKRTSQELLITSSSGARDYWSLATIGLRWNPVSGQSRFYASWRMDRSCQLYCGEDSGKTLELEQRRYDGQMHVHMISSGCYFYTDEWYY